MWLDSIRLCWCVRTAASAILRKPQSHCRLFVSLTGLDWTRLDSVGVYARPHRLLYVSHRVTAASLWVWLDWTGLDSTLFVCTHPKIHFGSTFSSIYSLPRQSLLFRLPTIIFIVNKTVAFRAQESKRQHLTRIYYFNNKVCSQHCHLAQRRELLRVKFALKQAMMAQRESINIALLFL